MTRGSHTDTPADGKDLTFIIMSNITCDTKLSVKQSIVVNCGNSSRGPETNTPFQTIITKLYIGFFSDVKSV